MKRNTAKAKKGNAELPALQIRNVMELRGVSRKGLLVHFTAEQWKAATKGLGKLKPGAKAIPALEASPIPGRPGEMIIGPRCPPGCTPVMRYQRAAKRRPGKGPSPVGYTPLPDDIFIPECICDPVIPEVPDRQPGINRTGCRMVFRFQRPTRPRVGPTAVLTCESTTCSRTCRLSSRRLPDGRIQIFCECRN